MTLATYQADIWAHPCPRNLVLCFYLVLSRFVFVLATLLIAYLYCLYIIRFVSCFVDCIVLPVVVSRYTCTDLPSCFVLGVSLTFYPHLVRIHYIIGIT